jgi:hypothetical protein
MVYLGEIEETSNLFLRHVPSLRTIAALEKKITAEGLLFFYINIKFISLLVHPLNY